MWFLLLLDRGLSVLVAVLVLDLNDFKVINDGLGHSAGDTVLKSVALCLRRGLRPHDVCGRQGGDDFYGTGGIKVSF